MVAGIGWLPGGVGAQAPLTVEARRVQLQGATLRAEGDVRLGMGSCRLRANELALEAKGGLSAEQPCLRAVSTPEMALSAHRLHRDSQGGLEVTHARAGVCACGGLVSLSAPAGWVRAHGARLHLSWPRLQIGSVPVAILPYLAVPLRPGVSGLLAPEVGYSGRDGLRLSQGLYGVLGRRADAAVWVGWVQKRGVSGRLRTRYFADDLGSGEVDLGGLRDGSRWRGWVRGGLGLRGRGWALRVDPYLVSDPQVPADLALDQREVFARYQRSRLWAQGRAGQLRLVAWGDLYQELGSPLQSQDSDLGRVGLRVDLRPVPLLGPWSVDLMATVGQSLGTPPASGGTGASLLSAAELAPRLSMDSRLGPLATSVTGSYRAQLRWGAAQGTSSESLEVDQAVVANAEVGLPLARTFGRAAATLKHLVEPVVAWQSAWGAGSAAPWTQARFERLPLPRGHFAGVGLRSAVMAQGRDGPWRQIVAADVRFWAAQSESRATAWLRASPLSWLAGRLRLGVRVDDPLVEQLDARACLRRWGGRFCAGYLRHRGAGGASTVIYAPAGFGSAGALLDPLVTAARLDELRFDAGWDMRRLRIGGQVAVDPAQGRVTQGGAWIRTPQLCGCLGLSLAVRVRTGQAVPDVFGQVTMSRPGWARCL